MNYIQRMQAVIDHIQQHLNEDLSLERLAKVANFSPFHFHRQFAAFTDMPAGRVVQLLRLRKASYRLVFEAGERITDIALDTGFENAESFSRAFKTAFGQSPSEFRAAPQWKPWLETFTFNNMGGQNTMEVEIVEFPQTPIALMVHRGHPAEMNGTLQRFVAWRQAKGLHPDKNATYNIAYNDPALVDPADYRFGIATQMDSDLDAGELAQWGLTEATIPAGRCAVLRHLGSSDNIGESATYLYREWLPTSGEELRDFPLFFDRVKLFPAQVAEREQITDIYLPLR